MAGSLSEYFKKRDFEKTGEPKGKVGRSKKSGLAFVVQKHGARRLHYDFRLELDGVMKSWAVTKGPSLDPSDKRLAVRTEDHPMAYNKFEGVIPEKQYGAGPVMIWDKGEWQPEDDPHKGLKKGHLSFELKGERMFGKWHLVRMETKEKRELWLLIKSDDEFAVKGKESEKFLVKENTSIVTSRTLEEIKKNKKPAASTKSNGQNNPGKAGNKSAASAKSIAELQKKYRQPELATLVDKPPLSEDWLHEIKYDGYRIMAFVSNGKVVLRTRGGKDWTRKFTPVAEGLKQLDVADAVLDGELGVLKNNGVTSFSALQNALSEEDASHIECWFFDLLYLDGKDYSRLPLIQRKEALEELLAGKDLLAIHYSEHFESQPDILEKACKVGAEGLISKNKNSLYRFRRTRDWVKSKCGKEQEFVIGGYMPAKNDSKAIGALLLGYYKDGKLRYAGKVGTGFTQEEAKRVYERLAPLKAKKSPFDDPVGRSRRRHYWVKPEVLCEVTFGEWTAQQHIRHASFKGLREDKAPKEVHKEEPETGSGRKSIKSTAMKGFIVEDTKISHPDREVFPGTGITKGEVAEYYDKVMPYFLPFLENRLISLVRCTDTIGDACFFQRAPMKGMGKHIKSKTLTHKGKKHEYIYVDSAEGVIELVQMGTIEFHAWQSQVEKVDKPNQIIFDLDPAEDVPFEAVKLAANDIQKQLKRIKLESYPRLTGGKGIHVVIPLKPEHTWDEIKDFSRDFAKRMEKNVPEAYTSSLSKKDRKGKIFVDYLRNDYSSTAIVPFSLRAREGAPVAVPVFWNEIDKIESAAAYNFNNIQKRTIKKIEKQIKEFLDLAQELPEM